VAPTRSGECGRSLARQRLVTRFRIHEFAPQRRRGRPGPGRPTSQAVRGVSVDERAEPELEADLGESVRSKRRARPLAGSVTARRRATSPVVGQGFQLPASQRPTGTAQAHLVRTVDHGSAKGRARPCAAAACDEAVDLGSAGRRKGKLDDAVIEERVRVLDAVGLPQPRSFIDDQRWNVTRKSVAPMRSRANPVARRAAHLLARDDQEGDASSIGEISLVERPKSVFTHKTRASG